MFSGCTAKLRLGRTVRRNGQWIGAYGKGDLTELVYGMDHTNDDLVQLVRGDCRTCSTLTARFLDFSRWKGVGVEDTEFRPGYEGWEATTRTCELHECVAGHEVPLMKFPEAGKVR